MAPRPSILLVDDYPDLLYNLSLPLQTAGYDILTAQTGHEALEILASERVDLILADIVMPEMDGYEFFRRVRQHNHWSMIPFMFLTGRTHDDDIRRGKELGVDDYLTKPIKAEHLLAAIRGKLKRVSEINRSRTRLAAGRL